MSDNMPFNSFDFKKVANEWGFELITHSPLYQKSNGLAERTVGIAKNMLKKCFETNTDIYLTLIEYRATPLTELELSPSELNFNRLLRTLMPTSAESLNFKNIDVQNIRYTSQLKQAYYYDQNSKVGVSFEPNDSIWLKRGKRWDQEMVIKKLVEPRSYLVRTSIDTQVRRNFNFIHR